MRGAAEEARRSFVNAPGAILKRAKAVIERTVSIGRLARAGAFLSYKAS